jgi:hypothetical protein
MNRRATATPLRFVPIKSSGNPLIVVDLLDVHWGIGSFSTTRCRPTNYPAWQQSWRLSVYLQVHSTTTASPEPSRSTPPLTTACWRQCTATTWAARATRRNYAKRR